MTIAAGFRCENGIVICADREVVSDSDKWEESKIFTLHLSSAKTSSEHFVTGSESRVRTQTHGAENDAGLIEGIEIPSLDSFVERLLFQEWHRAESTFPRVPVPIASADWQDR